MFYCFVLHATTSKNVLQMFHAKTLAKMLQKIFANVLARWTHVEDRTWLHVK